MNTKAVSLTTVLVTPYASDSSSTIGVHVYTIIEPRNADSR